MAIIKNTELWGIEDATVLEFGNADIQVSGGSSSEFGVLTFKTKQGAYINADYPEDTGKSLQELQPEVIMIFPCVESLDVVLRVLKKVREHMVELDSTEV